MNNHHNDKYIDNSQDNGYKYGLDDKADNTKKKSIEKNQL